MLITLAPWSTAHLIPVPMSELAPTPLLSSTRTGRIVTSGATPTMPTPLMPAPMIPATWVPWPLTSVLPPPSVTTPPWIDAPPSTRPARSGWSPCTPVSTMPTVMPAPLLHAQSELKGKLASAHCLSTSGSVGRGTVVVVVVVTAVVVAAAASSAAPYDGASTATTSSRRAVSERDADGLVERRVDARRTTVVVDGDDRHRILTGLRRLLDRRVGRCGDLGTPRERRSARFGCGGRRRRGGGRLRRRGRDRAGLPRRERRRGDRGRRWVARRCTRGGRQRTGDHQRGDEPPGGLRPAQR